MSKKMNTVLIVDDMSTVTEQANFLLKDHFVCLEANSPKEALRVMEETLPDIILCDLNMPDEDGFSLLTKLKKKKSYAEIPVIFMVIETSILTKSKAYEMGVVDFITKPFVPKELIRKLEANCRLREEGWKPSY